MKIEIDDDPNTNEPEVLMCPECETPNQFGEVCHRCEVDIQEAIAQAEGHANSTPS